MGLVQWDWYSETGTVGLVQWDWYSGTGGRWWGDGEGIVEEWWGGWWGDGVGMVGDDGGMVWGWWGDGEGMVGDGGWMVGDGEGWWGMLGGW